MSNALHLTGCGVCSVQLTGHSHDGAVRIYTNDLRGKEVLLNHKESSETVTHTQVKGEITHTLSSNVFLPLILYSIPIHQQSRNLPG